MSDNNTQATQTTTAKNPFLMVAEVICNDPMWGNKVGILVTEALHRVTEMEEGELRKFLPWLLFNDGELALASGAELAAIQTIIARSLPQRNWPRP